MLLSILGLGGNLMVVDGLVVPERNIPNYGNYRALHFQNLSVLQDILLGVDLLEAR